MATVITNAGGRCKILIDNNDTALYPSAGSVTMNYSQAANTVFLFFKTDIGSYSYNNIPIANLSILGVTITSIAVFDAQIAALFYTSNVIGNSDSTISSLVAASTNGNSADIINYSGRGVQLVIDITAITGTTPVLIATVQGKDIASGKYYTLLTSAALSTVSTNLLTVYPGAPTTANVSVPQVLPRTFRVLYTITGTAPAVTATIGASVII